MHIFEVDKPSSHAWPPPRSPQSNLTQPLQSPLPPTQPGNLNPLGLDTASDYAPRPWPAAKTDSCLMFTQRAERGNPWTGEKERRRKERLDLATPRKVKVTLSSWTVCDPMDCMSPARLLRPWDSPGKNTGVGCHALLQEHVHTGGI